LLKLDGSTHAAGASADNGDVHKCITSHIYMQ
jgi:hypothetical protein